MRQKSNPEILAWAEEKAQAGTDPNEMMRELLRAGWLFDAALRILQPYHPDWVTRQGQSRALEPAQNTAQRLQSALGVPSPR